MKSINWSTGEGWIPCSANENPTCSYCKQKKDDCKKTQMWASESQEVTNGYIYRCSECNNK